MTHVRLVHRGRICRRPERVCEQGPCNYTSRGRRDQRRTGTCCRIRIAPTPRKLFKYWTVSRIIGGIYYAKNILDLGLQLAGLNDLLQRPGIACRSRGSIGRVRHHIRARLLWTGLSPRPLWGLRTQWRAVRLCRPCGSGAALCRARCSAACNLPIRLLLLCALWPVRAGTLRRHRLACASDDARFDLGSKRRLRVMRRDCLVRSE
jgi:hypothetical protein